MATKIEIIAAAPAMLQPCGNDLYRIENMLYYKASLSLHHCMIRSGGLDQKDYILDSMIESLRSAASVTEFDDKLWNATVDHMTVNRDGSLVFMMRDGREIRVKIQLHHKPLKAPFIAQHLDQQIVVVRAIDTVPSLCRDRRWFEGRYVLGEVKRIL